MMFDWVYLCCNRWMLDFFLEVLPPIAGLRKIIVIANADGVTTNDPRCEVIRYDGPAHAYSLYVKLDLTRFTDIDMLYSDDDVICLRDPEYLGVRWCTGSHLDQLGVSDRDMCLCRMLSDVFEIEYTPLMSGCDAGIWYLTRDLKEELNLAVAKFFEHPLFNLVYDKPNSNWYRTIDQRILSGLFNKHKYDFIKSTRDIKVMYSLQCTIPRTNFPTFYHYGCSSHKREMARRLRDKYVVKVT